MLKLYLWKYLLVKDIEKKEIKCGDTFYLYGSKLNGFHRGGERFYDSLGKTALTGTKRSIFNRGGRGM